MVDINKIAPLPWKIEKSPIADGRYYITDSTDMVVISIIGANKDNLEYIVEAVNDHKLLQETCKKLVDQDTNNFEDMRKISYINTLVGETNQLLREEGDKLKIKLQIAITFLKKLDTEEGNSILELLREGVKL